MDKFTVGRIGIMVTGRCNLRCRLCSHMIPYWTNKGTIPLDQLKRTAKELFSIVERVGKLSFTGGEPFLSKAFPEFLEYMALYQDRVDQFDVITNGTIVPNAQLLAALGKFNHMKVIVDNYGPYVSKRFETVCQVLEGAGIPTERRDNYERKSHCDGWFDLLEIIDPPQTDEQAKEVFNLCIYSHDLRCNVVYGGKLFPCGRAMAFHRLKQIPKDKDLFVDLFDAEKTEEEKRDELLWHIQAEYFPACAYCQGALRKHQRHIPGEQLGADEAGY